MLTTTCKNVTTNVITPFIDQSLPLTSRAGRLWNKLNFDLVVPGRLGQVRHFLCDVSSPLFMTPGVRSRPRVHLITIRSSRAAHISGVNVIVWAGAGAAIDNYVCPTQVVTSSPDNTIPRSSDTLRLRSQWPEIAN